MPESGVNSAFIIGILSQALNIYTLLILVRALMSWFNFNPANGIYYILIKLTEPVLGPIRRLIPMQGIDFSPVIAILLIDLVIKRILLGLLSTLFAF